MRPYGSCLEPRICCYLLSAIFHLVQKIYYIHTDFNYSYNSPAKKKEEEEDEEEEQKKKKKKKNNTNNNKMERNVTLR